MAPFFVLRNFLAPEDIAKNATLMPETTTSFFARTSAASTGHLNGGQPRNTAAIIADINEGMEFVQERVVNREEVIEQIFLAMLIGEHVLLESRTGVGKTLLAEQVFRMFEGARTFKVQASKEQQPDTYFGGLLLEELKQGRLIHNTQGSLVESEFGFIDEIFDANDYTLRALLSLLNERELIRGVQRMQSSVHTVIAATNYLRLSEITDALLDRFLFKALIHPDKDAFFQYKISQQYLKNLGNAIEPPKKIQYADLAYATRIVRGEAPEYSIQTSPELVYFMNLVVRHYEVQRNRMLQERPHEAHLRTKDFYISPRTQAKSLDVLRAIAFLHGRTNAERSDIPKLHLLLCTAGIAEEKALFQRSYDTLLKMYQASGAFEQLSSLLTLEDVLARLRHDPALMSKPITELGSTQAKRSIVAWAKETLGVADATAAHKRRLAEGFLQSIHPSTEDLKSLKAHLEQEIKTVFAGHAEHF
ncbi:MAG TPA: AAA family ATPase [Candidatus Kapabacteria bacterium]|nr:AAA family ATPase [Candidatus Kapabacteria bacterium]